MEAPVASKESGTNQGLLRRFLLVGILTSESAEVLVKKWEAGQICQGAKQAIATPTPSLVIGLLAAGRMSAGRTRPNNTLAPRSRKEEATEGT